MIVIRFVEVVYVRVNGKSNYSKTPESAFCYLDNLFSIGGDAEAIDADLFTL